MANLRELAEKPELLSPGHRLCAGCGASITARQILNAADTEVVVANATGCLEVATTIYPYTAWRTSWIHIAFENTAATLSGVESAYRALSAKGKVDKPYKFIAFGGDGGTFDIGLQSLSGAMERGHDLLYICYDNEAYMNTGIQRSSATPKGAATTTSPAGSVNPGKLIHRKDLTGIMAAHNIPFVGQTTPAHWRDLTSKVERALEIDGPAFINVLAPCPRGWRSKPNDTIKLARLAADTCYWPLFEIDHGEYKVNYKPREKKPLREWLELQGRFRHLFTEENEHIIEDLQERVDTEWERLLSMEKSD
jgi:pyruvate ferredoxin oxidoreductase beta subunit